MAKRQYKAPKRPGRDYEQENAARRYRRQAATAERQAAKASGPERQRLLEKAQYLRSQIKYTYKQPPKDAEVSERKWQQRRERTMRESFAPKTKKERREREARQVMSIGNIGSRLFASTVQVWNMKANKYYDEKGEQHLDRSKVVQSILDYFEAETLMDVLEQFEEEGIDLYSAPEDTEGAYTMVTIRGMRFTQSIKRRRRSAA